MKILVINGSPKGKESITYQYVKYLEKVYNEDQFDVLHVGRYIKKYENDFSEVLNKLDDNDVILFVYPVYTFLVPSQLQRFIELLKVKKKKLINKFVSQITTSKHFYDVTAHKYIEENCHDLGLKYIKGFSADMEDLLKKDGEALLKKYWNFIHFSYENNIYETNHFQTIEENKYSGIIDYKVEKSDEYVISLVTDCLKDDIELNHMIEDFINIFKYKVKIINLNDFNFSGGCLGCLNCATTGKCVYKDGFDEFLRNNIQNSSTIIYAFRVKDHSMGSLFKMYDDRQFCNGHRIVTMEQPIGYIVAGNMSQENNLQTILEARAEVGRNYLAGIANSENELINLSKNLIYALENKMIYPSNFYGVGGMKIFRDLIYVNQGMMKADHVFYKKNKLYDFPQKEVMKKFKMKLIGLLLRIPSVRKKINNKMNEAMIKPYQKVIDNASKIK